MNRPAPLQSLSPNLYRLITMKLEDEYHIHPYDIQIFGTENEDGIHVTVSYGSQFSIRRISFLLIRNSMMGIRKSILSSKKQVYSAGK